MRSINLSTDVYAGIWSNRREGEETEDDILRRLLDLPPMKQLTDALPNSQRDGFRDSRFGVHFPEGFEIFRNYKGCDYRAVATNRTWKLLNDGLNYSSLHKLSQAVVSGQENSWENWRFDDGGKPELINRLRDPARVTRRKPTATLEDF
jgi:hypothetical protein